MLLIFLIAYLIVGVLIAFLGGSGAKRKVPDLPDIILAGRMIGVMIFWLPLFVIATWRELRDR